MCHRQRICALAVPRPPGSRKQALDQQRSLPGDRTIKNVEHGRNNDQNMRLLMPYTTMASYFPMPGEGNAKAVKYVAYQPITRNKHNQAKKAYMPLWREIITSIPRRRMRLRNGTRSKAPR